MLAMPAAFGAAAPSLAWRTVGWTTLGRGEAPIVFRLDGAPAFGRLRLVLAGQGALVTRVRLTFEDDPPLLYDRAVFCTGTVVSRTIGLGVRGPLSRIEVQVSAPPRHRAAVRMFGRLA